MWLQANQRAGFGEAQYMDVGRIYECDVMDISMMTKELDHSNSF